MNSLILPFWVLNVVNLLLCTLFSKWPPSRNVFAKWTVDQMQLPRLFYDIAKFTFNIY